MPGGSPPPSYLEFHANDKANSMHERIEENCNEILSKLTIHILRALNIVSQVPSLSIMKWFLNWFS